jgi:hypothetical protein
MPKNGSSVVSNSVMVRAPSSQYTYTHAEGLIPVNRNTIIGKGPLLFNLQADDKYSGVQGILFGYRR